ncbi:nucleotide-binding alpha-beta plait domain-containing protein [Artemisia annua]|uniref:Nucleotide-binding alpha-beta plait domain-containing protein n=1 Tax=Artemisia annua TaxID=35608 RepID=A0A2U1MEH5_ARTAN|nr:nucleotide-binding alpha-beta plait domain-containing protein [Artemisia annua]
MLDHVTGRSRGFGFVTFDSEEAVEKIFVDGQLHELGGKQVEIKRAEPKRAGGDFSYDNRPCRGGGSESYGGSFGRGSVATFEVDQDAFKATGEVNNEYGCTTRFGDAQRGSLGPFGIAVLADETLSELIPVYFYVAKNTDGGTNDGIEKTLNMIFIRIKKQQEFTTEAVIVKIDASKEWYFNRCRVYGKKIEEALPHGHCQRPGTLPLPNYR